MRDENVRLRHFELRLRLGRVDAVGRRDRVGEGDIGVVRAESEGEHLLLVLGELDEGLELFGGGPLVGVDPLGVEDDEGVVRVQRPFLRVDRHERHTRRT